MTDDFDNDFDDELSDNTQNNHSTTSDDSEIDDDILKQIDKKIIIKYMKEVRTSRTYIFGIHNYIRTKEERDKFVKHIKKSLGTSVIEKNDGDGVVYGFAGEHIKYIYDYIVKNNICPINEIKK